MQRIRYSAVARILALVLVVAMYVAPGTAWAKKRAPASVQLKATVLIFPMDQTADKAPAGLGREMASVMKDVIGAVPGYVGIMFSERLPSVARGLQEGSLRKADVSGSFTGGKSVAGKIAKDMHTDLYLIGSIDECSADVKKQSAQVTLSAQLVDSANGDVIKAVAVTGRSPEGKTMAMESDLAALAAGNAVAKAIGELIPGATMPEDAVAKTTGNASQNVVLPAIVKAPAAQKQMVLVFPIDVAASGAPAELGPQLAEWLKSSLGIADGYMATAYSERLPSVARMIQEGALRKSDISGSFAVAGSAASRIAKEVEADLYLIGTVDQYNLDSKAKRAEISITAQICSAASGKVINAVSVTGKSPVGAESASDRELISLAAGNAAAGVVKTIAPGAPVMVISDYEAAGSPNGRRAKRPGAWKMILLGIAVAGGLALASRDSNNSVGEDPDMPPPPVF